MEGFKPSTWPFPAWNLVFRSFQCALQSIKKRDLSRGRGEERILILLGLKGEIAIAAQVRGILFGPGQCALILLS